MQQQKQIIEYWFLTPEFTVPVLVRIKMAARDEARAKQRIEETFTACTLIEKPLTGQALLVNELWEL